MKKLLLPLLLLPFLIYNTVEAQRTSVSASSQSDIVKSAKTLFYYGADFSHVRISDGSKVSKNMVYSTAYPPAWITYINKELPPNGYIRHSLRKENLYDKQDEIYSVSIKVFPDFIIANTYSFPIDTVKKAIKEYTLTQKSGVGLVLIPENFNKVQEKAFTWIVFFDIQTREILWASEVTGHCEHMGYTAHWGSGVINGFKSFIHTKYNR